MNSYSRLLKEKKDQIQNQIAELKESFLVTDDIKEQRMAICNECEHFRHFTKQCKKCGCFMPAKTALTTSSCPIDKWSHIIITKN